MGTVLWYFLKNRSTLSTVRNRSTHQLTWGTGIAEQLRLISHPSWAKSPEILPQGKLNKIILQRHLRMALLKCNDWVWCEIFQYICKKWSAKNPITVLGSNRLNGAPYFTWAFSSQVIRWYLEACAPESGNGLQSRYGKDHDVFCFPSPEGPTTTFP